MNSIQKMFGTWYEPMKEFLHSQQMYDISQQLMQERKEYVVIPSEGSELFFKVFQITDYNSLKVIILG